MADIIGAGEAPYTRHPQDGTTTARVLFRAARQAVDESGIAWSDIDGLGVSSFTLEPDHAVDLAWRMGLGELGWLHQDTNGGASGVSMLQAAVDAVEAGRAENILLIAGDRMDMSDFEHLVSRYNSATAEHLAPLPMSGPNALFALLTQRQMSALGLAREDYGHLVLSQRRWASGNPGAVYREPMTMAQYLEAPVVAPPLGRYDCVPPVTGADAVVVQAADRASPSGGSGRARVRILAAEITYNVDDQDTDGLTTGLRGVAPRAWKRAGFGPEDLDVVHVYDDYPAMNIAQFLDIGLCAEGDVSRFIREEVATGRTPVNTSGGQLSAGQAGAGAGMHGVVEAVRQLSGRAPGRQITGASRAAVTGYGMVLYRYGACAGMTVLEAA
ncbi:MULTISPECIES: thiolase family protein [Actinomycetes]|uniref:Thiolase family protein n=2 Tax=Actinomycetes TaxID=1760 RepID=A0ABP6M000_9MICC